MKLCTILFRPKKVLPIRSEILKKINYILFNLYVLLDLCRLLVVNLILMSEFIGFVEFTEDF